MKVVTAAQRKMLKQHLAELHQLGGKMGQSRRSQLGKNRPALAMRQNGKLKATAVEPIRSEPMLQGEAGASQHDEGPAMFKRYAQDAYREGRAVHVSDTARSKETPETSSQQLASENKPKDVTMKGDVGWEHVRGNVMAGGDVHVMLLKAAEAAQAAVDAAARANLQRDQGGAGWGHLRDGLDAGARVHIAARRAAEAAQEAAQAAQEAAVTESPQETNRGPWAGVREKGGEGWEDVREKGGARSTVSDVKVFNALIPAKGKSYASQETLEKQLEAVREHMAALERELEAIRGPKAGGAEKSRAAGQHRGSQVEGCQQRDATEGRRMHREVWDEVRRELRHEVWEEVREEVREEVEHKLVTELLEHTWQELRSELREDVETELRWRVAHALW